MVEKHVQVLRVVTWTMPRVDLGVRQKLMQMEYMSPEIMYIVIRGHYASLVRVDLLFITILLSIPTENELHVFIFTGDSPPVS